MRNVEEGIYVQGLSDMQRVLRRAQHDLGPQLKRRLREAGGIVAPVARRNAPVGVRSANYRFEGEGVSLRDSIRISVTRTGASVYSIAPHGGVQNFGGRVGRNHATLLRRNNVSQYMTRAVRSTRPAVEARVLEVLDWLERELRS